MLGAASETAILNPIDADFERSEFLADCITGLSANPKTLSCKYLYDAKGSQLFEMICELPEYYQTRTEMALLRNAVMEIAARMDNNTALIEFGSGASVKTRILLNAGSKIATYVPIDICKEELDTSSEVIRKDYPDLAVKPIHADFTKPMALDPTLRQSSLLGFFPGSTIGNFEQSEAIEFLANARDLLGENSSLLLGVDLRKEIDVLIAAYDDAAGVTAAFNLNLLDRINSELDGNIKRDEFTHEARWNESKSRIEMHLVSRSVQTLAIGDRQFKMAEGESIHTENCHKFSLAQLDRMATAAGWEIENEWINDDPGFALIMLAAR